MLWGAEVPPWFWAEASVPAEPESTAASEGQTHYELFPVMKPDVGHIRTFGCMVIVVLSNKALGKSDGRQWAACQETSPMAGTKYGSLGWK